MTKTELNKNYYYLAISGLQKCIRRGLTDLAIEMYKIAYKVNPYYTRERIIVTLFEDVGDADLDAICNFIDITKNATVHWKDFGVYSEGIKCLSEAKAKTRDACLYIEYFSNIRSCNFDMCEAFVLNSKREELFERSIMYNYNLEKYSYIIDNVLSIADVSDNRIEKIIKFIQSLFNANRDIGMCYTMLGLLALNREPISVNRVEVNNYKMIDMFPDFAIDQHTMVGKIAISTLAKKNNIDPDYLARLVFFSEGDKLNNLAVYESDFKTRFLKKYKINLNDYDQYKNNIFSIRKWAYNKVLNTSNLNILG